MYIRTDYAITISGGTPFIEFSDPIELEKIQRIVNVTREEVLYSVENPMKTQITVSGQIVSFKVSPNLQETDILHIEYNAEGAGATSDVNIATDSAGLAKEGTLQQVLSELKDDINISETIWRDATDTYCVRLLTISQDNQTSTVQYYLPDGTLYTPTLPLVLAVSNTDRELLQNNFIALTNGTGYVTNDVITRVDIIDVTVSPVANLGQVWLNRTQQTVLSGAPPAVDLGNSLENLPTETSLQTLISNVGEKSEPPATSDTGSFSIIAFIKRALENWATLLGRVPINGQKTKANSLPVVVSSDQVLPVELGLEHLSPFGDLIFTKKTPIFQADFTYGIDTRLLATSVVSGGVVDTNNARLRLQSGINIAGSATIRSRPVIKYRQGEGVTVRFSVLFDNTSTTNNTRAVGVGAGASLDGYFVGIQNGVFGIFHYNRGSLSFVPQSAFNIDKCDGSGSSGFTINIANGNVIQISYPYLGYGNVTFFVQNKLTGRFIPVHQIRYLNVETQLGQPNLYFNAFNTNNGNTTNVSMFVGSVACFIDGERDFLGANGCFENSKALTASASVFTNIFSIKNATTFNGVENRKAIKLDFLSVGYGNYGNNNFGFVRIFKNSTLGGTPAFSTQTGSSSIDNGVTVTGLSPISIDTAGTTITDGEFIWNSASAMNLNSVSNITDKGIYIQPSEIVTFGGRVSNNGSMAIAVNWVEE